MAKDKKVDYNKLSLGVKLPVKKAVETPVETVVEQAVSNIHPPSPQESLRTLSQPVAPPPPPVTVVAEPEPVEVKKRTLRVTLDIPQGLHAEIRTYTFRKGVTMKEYFLDLAKKDIGLE
jgi:hypothetical protein